MKAGCLTDADFRAGQDDSRFAFLLLGRCGDLINSLPILKHEADILGHPVNLVVSDKFTRVLQGVSYVTPHPLAVDAWHGMPEALTWAKERFTHVINLQPACHEWTVPKRTPHFDLEPYAITGLLKDEPFLPLIFDKRNANREKQLVEKAKTGSQKPLFLVSMSGISNAFTNQAYVWRELNKWKPKLNFVDVDQFSDAPIFDLLGLMDAAIGMLTIDTATLHLAKASTIPFILLYHDGIPSWSSSSPKPRCVLSIGHSRVKKDIGKLHEVIGNLVGSSKAQIIPEKLDLPQVTLVAIDSFHPQRTLKAMLATMALATFADAVLVTSAPFDTQGTGIRNVAVLPTDARIERERFMITRITETFSTPFCLNMEWDACLRNPQGWNPEFLEYDFIGAPWPIGMRVPGYPRIDHSCSVGNTGFCLMSKKFADTLTQASKPTEHEVSKASDIYVCVTLRPTLEALGIRFAPRGLASRFSCEGTRYSGQLGWHGTGTAALNRFRLPT